MRTFRSAAKLNLHLEVLSRRPDGYHDLRTVFQTIDLTDELRLDRRRRAGVELVVEGADLPSDRRNLAFRAAEEFLHRWGAPGDGVRLELVKRIPPQSGLGGGSSNAATVLIGLSRLYRRDPWADPHAAALAAAGAALGADVPFLLLGGTAVGAGRGERLTALDDVRVLPLAAGSELWLALPPYGLATADVFARAKPSGRRAPPEPLARALAGSPVAAAELIGVNDLETAAFALRPELAALYTALVRGGAERVRMSGSGSALFALFRAPGVAASAQAPVPAGTAWLQVSMLGRAAWRRVTGFDAFEGGN